MLLRMSAIALLASLVAVTGFAQEEVDPLAGVKCIVAGSNPAKADQFAEYMEGKVYFCCSNCKQKFIDDHEKYQVKANHQLLVTGQYEQKGCPFSGKPVSKDAVVNVGGVEVAMCGTNCSSKVEQAENLEAKAELVFNHKAFAKGFQKAVNLDGIACPVRGAAASKEFAAKYMGRHVYFCCNGCASKFAEDKEKFATLANYQLAATGQFVQKNCPISGRAMKEDIHAKVGKLKVGFCCNGCSGKVTDKETVDDKIKLVFATENFKKAFVNKNKVNENKVQKDN